MVNKLNSALTVTNPMKGCLTLDDWLENQLLLIMKVNSNLILRQRVIFQSKFSSFTCPVVWKKWHSLCSSSLKLNGVLIKKISQGCTKRPSLKKNMAKHLYNPNPPNHPENRFIKSCLILSSETLLYCALRMRPQCCMLHFDPEKWSFHMGGGGWETWPLFLNFLDPPLQSHPPALAISLSTWT